MITGRRPRSGLCHSPILMHVVQVLLLRNPATPTTTTRVG